MPGEKFEDALGRLIIAHEKEGADALIEALDFYQNNLEDKRFRAIGGSPEPQVLQH